MVNIKNRISCDIHLKIYLKITVATISTLVKRWKNDASTSWNFNWDPRCQRRTIRVCARTKNSLRKRELLKEESPSSRRRRPISCKYTGVIPDAVGLCAKLYSDYRNPLKWIFYNVSNCHNPSEVYEESEYTVRRRLCRLTTATINRQQLERGNQQPQVIIFVCCRIMTWIFVGVFDAKSVNGHFSFYCCKSLETVANTR